MAVFFNDQECVAALNSCIDLVAWREVPANVRDRVEYLLRKKRLQMVCFFATAGFGLRVYNDANNLAISTSGDEAMIVPKLDTSGQVDLDGHWVRCPKSIWLEKKGEKEYIVASPNGRKFFDNDPSAHSAGPWTGIRSSAVVYNSKEAAEQVIKEQNLVGAVILEK